MTDSCLMRFVLSGFYSLCVLTLSSKILKGGEYLHYCDMNTEKIERYCRHHLNPIRYIRLCSCINTCEGNCTICHMIKRSHSRIMKGTNYPIFLLNREYLCVCTYDLKQKEMVDKSKIYMRHIKYSV